MSSIDHMSLDDRQKLFTTENKNNFEISKLANMQYTMVTLMSDHHVFTSRL
jgi:hypothetical protein